ncbi:MAG: HD domain-containing protein [Oligoflexia bacterium]|nr:HD domain-containing protein [Oligoflexia bacterium]
MSEQKTKAIILFDNNFDNNLLYAIEIAFNFEVVMVSIWEELLKNLVNDVFHLIILSSTSDNEILQKINQHFKTKKMECGFINSALIIVGDYNENDENLKEILNSNIATIVKNKIVLSEIGDFIKKNFTKDDTFIESEYSPISLKTLMRFKILSFPVYIKLKTRYLQVLSIGDRFFPDDLNKYYDRGITHLYLKLKTSRWIIKKNTIDIDVDVDVDVDKENVDISTENEFNPAVNTDETIAKSPQEVSTVDTEAVINSDSNIEANQPPHSKEKDKNEEELTLADEFRLINDNDIISTSIGAPFKLGEEQIVEVKNTLDAIVKTALKSPEICKMLKMLKINRNKSEYYVSHVGNLINICTAIASQIDWRTERTIEKLVYACYFHDVGLSEKPELAAIKTESEAQEKGLSAKDLTIYLAHPTKIATILREIDGFPDDVHLIVEQHHEDPKGNGFPKKISGSRIIPLSALFMISHSLVDYMIDNPQWNITDFIINTKKDFQGQSFRKIIQSLEKIKDKI